MEKTEEVDFSAWVSMMRRFGKLHICTLLDGVNASELSTMKAIRAGTRKGQVRVSELSGMLHVNSTAVSRTLRELEKKGWILRSVNKEDRRITYVTLTSQGEEQLKISQQQMNAFASQVFARVGHERISELIAGLNQLLDVSENVLQEQTAARKKRTVEQTEK